MLTLHEMIKECFLLFEKCLMLCIVIVVNPRLNTLTPISDQDRISPYNINTLPSRQVRRIKKNIN